MRRLHAITLSLLIGAVVATGAVALTRGSAGPDAPAPAVADDAEIARRIKELDAAERQIREQLASVPKPPPVPASPPRAAAAPAARPAVIVQQAPAAQAPRGDDDWDDDSHDDTHDDDGGEWEGEDD